MVVQAIAALQREFSARCPGGDILKAWPKTSAVVVDVAGGTACRVHCGSDKDWQAMLHRYGASLAAGTLADADLRTQISLFVGMAASCSGPDPPCRMDVISCLARLWAMCGVNALVPKVCARSAIFNQIVLHLHR